MAGPSQSSSWQSRISMAGQFVRPGAVVQVLPADELDHHPHAVHESNPPQSVIHSAHPHTDPGTLWVVRGRSPERIRRHLNWPVSSVELVSPTTGAVVHLHGEFKGGNYFRILDDGSNK